ncbi:MAG: extracellular solute-binding protein [Oscillospiraceae bacterium]|nr:extracellular solute-binding protein [Oscillospiraceae bacterium]
MKLHLKKIVSLALAVLMVAGLAACGKEPAPTDHTGKVLTVGIQQRAAVDDMDNNLLTLYLEEKLGIDIQFVPFALGASDWRAQVNAMIAAGEPLPDVMWGFGWNENERYDYGSQGYIIDLTDLMRSESATAAAYRERMAEVFGEDMFETVMRNIASPDGAVYGFPTIVQGDTTYSSMNVFINQKWLDNLGLEVPTNMDELMTVLRAFKTQDPNQNGKADEFPAVGQVGPTNTTTGTQNGDLPAWIINNYQYTCDKRQWNSVDGKLYSPYITDEYREGLKTLNTMVSEGLVDAFTWTSTYGSSEMTAMWTPANDTAIAGVVAGAIAARVAQDSPVALEYVPLPPFNYAPIDINNVIPPCNIFITESCQDTELAFDMLLAMTDFEGTMRARRGVEGEHWVLEEDDSPYGQGIRQLVQITAPHHVHWGAYVGHLVRGSQDTYEHDIRDPEQVWSNSVNDIMLDHEAAYVAKADANNPKETVDKIIYSPEETEELGTRPAELLMFIKESRAKFATGAAGFDPNSDADWANYLQTLDNMGLQDWLRISQGAYDRMNGK